MRPSNIGARGLNTDNAGLKQSCSPQLFCPQRSVTSQCLWPFTVVHSPWKLILKTNYLAVVLAVLLNGTLAAETRNTQVVSTIANGFACDGGVADNGWFVATLLIEQPDEPFRSQAASRDYESAAAAVRSWQSQFVGRPRRIVIATQDAPDRQIEIASADRIFGPACPQEPVQNLTVAWTQKQAATWSLMLRVGEQTTELFRSDQLLTNPAITSTKDGLLVACEANTGSQAKVLLFRCGLGQPLVFPGRNPQLASSLQQSIVISERAERNSIRLEARRVTNGRITRTVELPHRDDYTFNADVIFDPAARQFIVITESCPAFGMNDLFGQHRDIDAYALSEDGDEFEPFPTANHRIPDPRRAFRNRSVENMTPIRPQLFLIDEQPVAAYRRFRFRGIKTFGWDILVSRPGNEGWSRPVRVSETYGMPDTGFNILPQRDSLLLASAACDQQGRSRPCTNHRVRLETIDQSLGLPETDIPAENRGNYVFPTSVRDIAPAPIRPLGVPEKYELLFGDTHQHSTYSKCTSAYNGMPDEVLRYLRDVLDLDILCLSEHGCYLSAPSITYTLDLCEAAAGEDRIVLFATEPGTTPGRHTNYFAADREVFERLQLITLGHRHDRRAVYRQIKDDLPPGSVVAARHFHGRSVQGKKQMLASFDSEIEVAMEAMQGRVNAMLPGPGNGQKAELFPTNYLNAGCKVGIIGGTDHYRGVGPNHYCLTGFWVRKRTGEGVLESMRNRRTVGMADAKIGLWATLDGHPMGSEVSLAGKVDINVSVSSASTVRRACLIRDGELLPWQNVDADVAKITLTDREAPAGDHWYVVTVEADAAFEDTAIAHTSPFFVANSGAPSGD